MEEWEWLELFKEAVTKIQEPATKQLLECDENYQKTSEKQGKLEEQFMKIVRDSGTDGNLLEEFCDVRDSENLDYSVWSLSLIHI